MTDRCVTAEDNAWAEDVGGCASPRTSPEHPDNEDMMSVEGASEPPDPSVQDPVLPHERLGVEPAGVHQRQHLPVADEPHPVLLALGIDVRIVARAVPQLGPDRQDPSRGHHAGQLPEAGLQVRPEEVGLHRRDHVEGPVPEREGVHGCEMQLQPAGRHDLRVDVRRHGQGVLRDVRAEEHLVGVPFREPPEEPSAPAADIQHGPVQVRGQVR